MRDSTAISELTTVDQLRNQIAAQAFYNNRYENSTYMDDRDWSAEKRARVARLISELPLPATGTVLDFGCGTGVFTGVLKSALPSWQVVGTDISSEALKRAQSRLPMCRFFDLSEIEHANGQFDLIFSHHVLEHVSDLSHVATVLAQALRLEGAMLHILPCGNPDSLAHRVCERVRNGIDAERGNRYFFEEVGHLRRLTTDDLVALWKGDGFQLRRAYYAEQFLGALNAVTQFDLAFVKAFADPGRALDAHSARSLWRLRSALSLLWFIRKPAAVFRNKRKYGRRNARDWALFIGSAVAFPFAASVEWTLKELAAVEWECRREDPAGSEMYLFLARGGGPA